MISTARLSDQLAGRDLVSGLSDTHIFTYPFDENAIRLWRQWAKSAGHVAHGMDPDFLLPFLDDTDNTENVRLVLKVRNDECQLAVLVARRKSWLFPNLYWELFRHEHLDVSGFARPVPGQDFDSFFELAQAGLAQENIALRRLYMSNVQYIENGTLKVSRRCAQYHAFFDLEGDASYQVPARLARNHRRLERKLTERNGRLRLEISPADPENTAEFFEIEATAWKGRAMTAIISDAGLQRIYQAVSRHEDSSSKASIATLYSGDHIVASAFCLVHPDYILLLKIGYLPEFARFSPGSLMISRILDYARAERKSRLCLSTDPRWASRWKPDRLEKQTLFVYAKGPIGSGIYVLDRLLQLLRKLFGHSSRRSQGA